MSPKISIVIPVYNVEKYLRQCLDSVVNQTLKDLQIICVDDGSTDGSLAILQEYASKDERIEVYSKPNEGAGIARNFAYSFIKGKYTFFMDPDDWLASNGLELLYNCVEKSQAEVVFLNYMINEGTSPVLNFQDTIWNNPSVEMRNFFLSRFTTCSWGRLLKTSFMLNNNIYFSEALRAQDCIVHWKACLLGNIFCYCSGPIYHYRIVYKHCSENKIRYNYRCLSILSALQELEDYLKEMNFYEDYISSLSPLKFQCIWGYYQKADKNTKSEFRRNFDIFTNKDWEELLRLPYPISLKMFFFFISLKYKFPFFLWIYGFIKRIYERITGKFPPVQADLYETEK